MMSSGRSPMVKPIVSTLGFLGTIFDTMQNWQDNLLTRAPGHADRICTIRLGQGEGGMNLDMTPETITGMIRAGSRPGPTWVGSRAGRLLRMAVGHRAASRPRSR